MAPEASTGREARAAAPSISCACVCVHRQTNNTRIHTQQVIKVSAHTHTPLVAVNDSMTQHLAVIQLNKSTFVAVIDSNISGLTPFVADALEGV